MSKILGPLHRLSIGFEIGAPIILTGIRARANKSMPLKSPHHCHYHKRGPTIAANNFGSVTRCLSEPRVKFNCLRRDATFTASPMSLQYYSQR